MYVLTISSEEVEDSNYVETLDAFSFQHRRNECQQSRTDGATLVLRYSIRQPSLWHGVRLMTFFDLLGYPYVGGSCARHHNGQTRLHKLNETSIITKDIYRDSHEITVCTVFYLNLFHCLSLANIPTSRYCV